MPFRKGILKLSSVDSMLLDVSSLNFGDALKASPSF